MSFVIFVAIFVPLSILIGVASATIGFTAWTIVVPLLFVGFDFDIFDTLFVSVLVDCVDGGVLTLIYAFKGKVDWPTGLILGPIGAICAFGTLFSAEIVLDDLKWLLKRGMGYGIVAIGLAFLLRWFLFLRKIRKHKAKLAASPLETDPLLINEESSTVQENNSEYGIDGIEKGSSQSSDKYSEQSKKECSEEKNKNKEEDMPTTLGAWFYTFDGPLGIWLPVIRYTLVFLLAMASGAWSGILGFGSGTNFVLIIFILLNFELLDATATGCFIMFILMFSLSVGYFIGIVPVKLGFIWPYALVAVSSSSVGTILGSLLALRISPLHLNLLIGAILVIIGLVAVIQPVILKHHHL